MRAIRAYIALDKPKAAAQYLAILKQSCQLLANNPALGIQREEYLGLYKFPVDSYLIYYRPTKAGIEVIRILPGNRDVEVFIKANPPS